MTPLATALHRLGWSRDYAASRWGCGRTTMRQWCEGHRNGRNGLRTPVAAPVGVLAWAEECADAVERVTKKHTGR